MDIIEQGRVRVHGLSVFRSTEDIALLEIDLHTKYADILSYSIDHEGMIEIMYEDTEYSLFIDEDQEPGSLTIVRLSEYKGWSVYSMNHSRYSTTIALFKGEKDGN